MKSLAVCVAFVLVGCGPAAQGPDPATPPTPTSAPESKPDEAAPAPDGSAAPSAAPVADAPPAADEKDAMTLARDLLKSGGRRIGWSSAKKGFVIPQMRRNGQTASLDIVFTDDGGHQRDILRICQPGECEEQLTAKSKEALPKLVERLDSEGYVSVRAIGWPSDRDELDVSSLHMKLKLSHGKLEGVREGKPAAKIGVVKPSKLLAIYPVLDAKKMGVFSSEEGEDQNQTFSVLPLP